MDKEYYLLSAENAWFPLGCIFEMSEKQKLLCLDNNKMCGNITNVFSDCIKIDRKSSLLLLPVPLNSRLQLWNDTNWTNTAQLDVGDDCFHMMTGHEMPCKIYSKQLGDKGINFTITLENGKRCNLTIDRLRLKKMSQSLPSVKNRIANWSSQSVTVYDRILKKDAVSNCMCLSNILQRAHDLDMTLKEKELLFKHLFSILPKLPDDDDGKCSLHWACYYLLADSVTTLITTYGAINKQDKQGNVPLYMAINSPLVEIKDGQTNKSIEIVIRTLLSRGADINIRNCQNETPLMKIFKNGNFSILEIFLDNYTNEFRLSDHLLSDQASILELLIKMKMFNLASLCCIRCKGDQDQNLIFIKSAVSSLVNGAKDLCVEILGKASDVNENLPNGELFLTQILSDITISSEYICFIINSISFKLDKFNKKYEYPLSLACRRLMGDVVKLIFNKSFSEVTTLNDALGETINAYNEIYINFTYKSIRSSTFQSITQVKQIATEILDMLLKNGANIETAKSNVLNLIENCIDKDFAKVIKHLCRIPTLTPRDSVDSKLSFSFPIQSTNQCSICMDRIIDCAFACGHTCCFDCGNKLLECHACRNKITERRKIFIS